MSAEQPSKRIIIDEDWKSQVERERETLRKTSPQEASQPETRPPGQPPSAEELPGPPPASLEMLVTVLATEALAAMGQIQAPQGGKTVARLDWAKYHIDTLALLQEKTRGNLSADEANLLEDALHELRMVFVAVQQNKGQ